MKYQPLTIVAEVREVKGKKLVSLDMEYSIKLITEDRTSMDLVKLPSDTMFKITFEVVK